MSVYGKNAVSNTNVLKFMSNTDIYMRYILALLHRRKQQPGAGMHSSGLLKFIQKEVHNLKVKTGKYSKQMRQQSDAFFSSGT